MGNWKGVRQNILRRNNPDPLRIELYDLADDIGETRDVAAQHPEIVARMREAMPIATKAVENVVWAIQMVVMPRPSGQPRSCAMETNSSNRDSPVMTSGITSGAVIIPANR